MVVSLVPEEPGLKGPGQQLGASLGWVAPWQKPVTMVAQSITVDNRKPSGMAVFFAEQFHRPIDKRAQFGTGVTRRWIDQLQWMDG